MNFKKLVKSEDFDAKKEQLGFDAAHSFYKGLEGTAYYYKKEGLSKEEIMSALEEAKLRLEEAFEEI